MNSDWRSLKRNYPGDECQILIRLREDASLDDYMVAGFAPADSFDDCRIEDADGSAVRFGELFDPAKTRMDMGTRST